MLFAPLLQKLVTSQRCSWKIRWGGGAPGGGPVAIATSKDNRPTLNNIMLAKIFVWQNLRLESRDENNNKFS